MIRNRQLPQWLHRLACGAVGSAAAATVATLGLRYLEPDSWLHAASRGLLWLSLPIGIVLACVAPRWSVVEGCAGDAGYEDMKDEPDNGTGPKST
jgi:hypothetical protein